MILALCEIYLSLFIPEMNHTVHSVIIKTIWDKVVLKLKTQTIFFYLVSTPDSPNIVNLACTTEVSQKPQQEVE